MNKDRQIERRHRRCAQYRCSRLVSAAVAAAAAVDDDVKLGVSGNPAIVYLGRMRNNEIETRITRKY